MNLDSHIQPPQQQFDTAHQVTRSRSYILKDEHDVIESQVRMKGEGEKVITFRESANAMIMTSWLNVLLLSVPIAILSWALSWSDVITFIFSLIALAPLAERLGFVTEQISLHTNESIGGLLNATFGNATELIVSVAALQKGLFRLVQLSLLGSILSNLLLVLGMAFFFGGLKHPVQNYNKVTSQVNCTLLILSVMAIMYPTILYSTGQCTKLGEIGLSRAASFTLLALYVAYIYFQLYTHRHVYDETPIDEPMSEKSAMQRNSNHKVADLATIVQKTNSHLSNQTTRDNNEFKSSEGAAAEPQLSDAGSQDSDDEEEDLLGFWNAMIWLAVITALIAVLSEAISSSIENAASSAGVSSVFIAAIVLPIVGNAAEHAGAVVFAMKGKLDLTLGIAVGSSTQIALCVLPLLVILGWMMGQDLDLDFGPYESLSVLLTVIAVAFAIKDGESNWLLGLTLIGAYVIISAGFIAHHNTKLDRR